MAETKGRGGCSRDGKLRGMGPPSSCLSIWGISVCAIRLGLRSLEDGRPRDGWRRDGCPRDGCTRDGCPRDGGRPRRMPLRRMWPRRMSPRRRKAETEETDVPETEGVLLLFFCNIVESLSGSSVFCESLCSTLLTKIPFLCLFSRMTIPNISTQRRNK